MLAPLIFARLGGLTSAEIPCFSAVSDCGIMTQIPRSPNLEAQRAAMKKLEFLVGKWSGEARLWRSPEQPLVVLQTEEVQYKLGGLVLVIEGVGRTVADNKPVLQALGIISYDDEAGAFHMRAFNDGRFLETDVRLLEDGEGLAWGFGLGDIRTNSTLRVSDKENWTELTEITVGSQPTRRFLELAVKRQK